VTAPRPDDFRRRHFPAATDAQWGDWRWQMQHSLRRRADLERVFTLSADESAALDRAGERLPLSITPYYAGLMADDPADPLRRTMIPVSAEFRVAPEELRDPLGEDAHTPVPGLVHRYPDRALFLVTDRCPVYCRYCTRSRLVGGGGDTPQGPLNWDRAIQYIAATPAIRDVLISGGDPLVFSDARLEPLLAKLHAIPHLEMIRIGSKIPVSLPQRITPELCAMLRQYHPLYLSLHVNHPRELSAAAARACERLADAGIPLGGQTVLLRGINDDIETLKALMHGLLRVRVRPYYLLQRHLVQGSAHFRTTVEKGLELIRGLRGHTSGYAVPHYIVDLPDGGGKIALTPDMLQRREGNDLIFTNFQGREGWRYPAAPGIG